MKSSGLPRVSLRKTAEEIGMETVCNALPVSAPWERGYSAQDGGYPPFSL